MLTVVLASLAAAAAQPAAPPCVSVAQTARLAAEADPRVDGARADVRAAEAGFTEALSLRRPQVTAFSRTRSSNSGPLSSEVDNQIGLQVSQTLLDFGDARFARQSARNQVRAGEYFVQAQQLSSAATAAQAHLDYIQSVRERAILLEQIAYFADLRARLEPLLQQGAATRDSVAAVRARIAAAEAEAATLELSAIDARTQIAVLTGRDVPLCEAAAEAELLALAQVSPEPPAAAAPAPSSPASPGVQALRAEVAAARADARRIRRERLPVIALSGVGTYQYDDFRDEWVFQDRIGVDVTVPLYQGGLAGARASRADAEVARRRSRLMLAERRLSEDVRTSAERIRSLRRLRAARVAAANAKRTELDALEIAFEGGQRTLFELLETRVGLSEARLALNLVEYQLLSEYLRLAAVTGRLDIDLERVDGPPDRQLWGWEPDPAD